MGTGGFDESSIVLSRFEYDLRRVWPWQTDLTDSDIIDWWLTTKRGRIATEFGGLRPRTRAVMPGLIATVSAELSYYSPPIKARREAANEDFLEKYPDGMSLPNPNGLWSWGRSIGVYSKGYKKNSVLGQSVFDYKYRLKPRAWKSAIEKSMADSTLEVITHHLQARYPKPDRPPFDVCLGVPPNNPAGTSLPIEICREISSSSAWLANASAAVLRTRQIEPIKFLDEKERGDALHGLYSIDVEKFPKAKHGILIVDDIFETGSTVSAICQALSLSHPHLPRFVLTLTHLKKAEGALR